MSGRIAAALLTALLSASSAQQSVEYRNWFHDPFFQVSNSIAGCAVPAGPYLSEAERRVQAHHRAEKGTSCWLGGACSRPNSYAYDQDIAAALKPRFEAESIVEHSTLWITVQGRIVFIEGCVEQPDLGPQLEALARGVPDVQQAIALVCAGAAGKPPYRIIPESGVRR